MKEKSLHIIAVTALVIYIVLGLACTTVAILAEMLSDDAPTNTATNTETESRPGEFQINQGSLIIAEGVTRIGERAFAGNNLTSVTISDNVSSFNTNIFDGSRNLTQISIGPNVNITGSELLAFYNFVGAYMINSRRAGTYTFTDGRWVAQFR